MRRFRTFAIPEHAHPLVRKLFGLMRRDRVSPRDVAERAGLAEQALWAWGGRCSPTLHNFEAALNVMGYRLKIEAQEGDGD